MVSDVYGEEASEEGTRLLDSHEQGTVMEEKEDVVEVSESG